MATSLIFALQTGQVGLSPGGERLVMVRRLTDGGASEQVWGGLP
jgi:hypothetical protein